MLLMIWIAHRLVIPSKMVNYGIDQCFWHLKTWSSIEHFNVYHFPDDANIASILLKNGDKKLDLDAVNMGWKALHLAAANGK